MRQFNPFLTGVGLIVAGAIILRLLGYRYTDTAAIIVMVMLIIIVGASLTSRQSGKFNR